MKKKKPAPTAHMTAAEKPALLKDLLDAATIAKLKEASKAMEAEKAREQELKRKKEEETKQAERKRLENDFAYLLENSSPDWKNYK